MPDQIRHDDLTSLPTRRERYRLQKMIERDTEMFQTDTVSALAALGTAFIAICDQEDIDPGDALLQIADAVDTGALDVSVADVSDIDKMFGVH